MKRILAILCVMACLLALALPVMAAPDAIVVTAQVPTDWEKAYIHVWGDSGDLTTWPGEEMTKGADGRFSVEILSGYNKIIINNGDGTQSQDMVFNGTANCWIVYNGQNSTTYDSDPGIVDINSMPKVLNSLAIVGSGLPGINSWDPADSNGDMTANGNIYTISFDLYKDTTITFKICGNDSWDSGFNYGASAPDMALTAGTAVEMVNGSSDNMTYTATQDCTLTVTADLSGDPATVKVEEKKKELAPPPVVEMVKVTATVPAGITPYIYTWDDGGSNAAWPGVQMTQDGDSWTAEIPATSKNLIINDGGSTKTTDTPIESGKNLKIVVKDDWSVEVTAEGDTNKPSTGNNDSTAPTTKPTDEPKKDNSLVVIIVAIVLAVAAVTAVVVVVILKKK